jgi:iron uptake system EfeUOB component EfeO/EfeM
MNTYYCFHSAAREALGEQEKGKNGVENMWSEEIEDAVKRKKSSYLTALSTKKTEDWETYKNDTRNVQPLVTHESNRGWDQKCAEIDTYVGRSCTEVWKIL